MKLRWSRAGAGLMAAAALGVMTTALAAQATRPQSNEDTTRSLLAEVHALRVAMERLATAGPRAELAFGRLQIQEQRLTNLTTQLNSVRDRIRGDVVGSFRDELSAQERDLEQQIATEQARWAEMNQRLEELDHALAAPVLR